MRYAVTMFVALMLVFAGCSSGGSGGTPTGTAVQTQTGPQPETPTSGPNEDVSDTTVSTSDGGQSIAATDTVSDTRVNADSVPGFDGSHLTNGSALATAFRERIVSGPAAFELQVNGSTPNGSADALPEFAYVYRNDTQRTFVRSDFAFEDLTVQRAYYLTDTASAVRNGSSGAVRYENREQLDFKASLQTDVALQYVDTIAYLDWNPTATTTVDGETAYVLEADSPSDQATAGSVWTSSQITSADAVYGRLIVDETGAVHTGALALQSGDQRWRMEYELDTDDSITVSQPDWYDEDDAENQTTGDTGRWTETLDASVDASETVSDTRVDATAVPGFTGTRMTNSTTLTFAVLERIYRGPSAFDLLVNTFLPPKPDPWTSLRYTHRNDTDRQFATVDGRTGSVTAMESYYWTDGRGAVRNTSTGNVTYAEGYEVRWAHSDMRAGLIRYILLIENLDWQPTATRTRDGQTLYVLEADRLTDAAQNASSLDTRIVGSADSVYGELLVDANGTVHAGTVATKRDGSRRRIGYTLTKDQSITVSPPDWYDEDGATAATE